MITCEACDKQQAVIFLKIGNLCWDCAGEMSCDGCSYIGEKVQPVISNGLTGQFCERCREEKRL